MVLVAVLVVVPVAGQVAFAVRLAVLVGLAAEPETQIPWLRIHPMSRSARRPKSKGYSHSQ